MKNWHIFFTILVFVFILSPAVQGQSGPCLETWVRAGGTPYYYYWTVPPCYTAENPAEMGQSACEIGVCHFDQTWRLPSSLSWIFNIQLYRATANCGPCYFYVSSDSTALGVLALDLTNQTGLWGVCKWSSPFAVNLNQLSGFNFVPGQPVYLRVINGSNAHNLAGMRFWFDEAIGVEAVSWGTVKTLYR